MEQVSFEEGNDRLLLLASTLDEVPERRFNYRHWVGEDWAGDPDLSCGTTACAFGWATTIPKFRALGLSLHKWDPADVFGTVLYTAPDGTQFSAIRAAEAFFGLTLDQAYYVFMPGTYAPGRYRIFSPNGDATAKQVATHIREFVDERVRMGKTEVGKIARELEAGS